jgi:hypothetical protein
MKRTIVLLVCLWSVSARAEPPALPLWDQLTQQGYDSYNATKCYINTGRETCTYTSSNLTTCSAQIWGAWIDWTMTGNFTRPGNYSGMLSTKYGNTTRIQYGNRVYEDHGAYVVLQRFFNAAPGGGSFSPYCEIRRARGITFAVRSF